MTRVHRAACAALLLILLVAERSSGASAYLSAGESLAIGAGSASLATAGFLLNRIEPGRTPLIKGPLLFDRPLQKLLAGGPYREARSNFLDRPLGGLGTPVVASTALFFADLTWPRGTSWKFASQDLFLCVTGLVANKGINDMVKGLVARPRPYTEVDPGPNEGRVPSDFNYDHNSFYSGHTSSSFFAANFLNQRLRSIMRDRMREEEYRRWRWAPPVLLYGWAAFVGWSRIDSYDHYPSDVLVGALAGVALGELFFSLGGDQQDNSDAGAPVPVLLRFSFTF